MPVSAAVGGPVSAAPLKGTLRGWTTPAPCWAARRRSGPPSARQRAQTAAAPCLTSLPPGGAHGRHRRRCALPVPSLPLAPRPPVGALPLATAPTGKRLCRSCLLREAALPSRLGLPPHGGGHAHQRAGLLGLHLSLACLSFLLARLAMYCRSAPASRPGPQRGWGCA